MAKGNQTRWIALGAVAFVALLAYFTFQQSRKEYEVCMSFKGQTHCSTAKGATPEAAIRSAQEIDCGLITSGRDENIVCLDTQPASVREVR